MISNEKKGFLISPRWELIRKIIKKRSNNVCEFCLLRRFDEGHHRIDNRKEHSYLDPHILDIMAICGECHDYLHRSRHAHYHKSPPTFHRDSIASQGDSGFTTKNQQPGHWYRFLKGYHYWQAIIPEFGKVSYDPNHNKLPKFAKNINLFLFERELFKEFNWVEVKPKLLPPQLTRKEAIKIEGAFSYIKTVCHKCNKDIDSHGGYQFCGTCNRIICESGHCLCSFRM